MRGMALPENAANKTLGLPSMRRISIHMDSFKPAWSVGQGRAIFVPEKIGVLHN